MSTLTSNANNNNTNSSNSNNNNLIFSTSSSPSGATVVASGLNNNIRDTTSASIGGNFHNTPIIINNNNNNSGSSGCNNNNNNLQQQQNLSTPASATTATNTAASATPGNHHHPPQHHHQPHHHHQSVVSSAKRLLPFARSMSSSSSSNGGAAAGGTAVSPGTSLAASGGSSTVAGAGSAAGTNATNTTTSTTSALFSSSSAGGSAATIPAELNIVLHGYHRKLKTNKKKYFVVYGDTADKQARLEYFDSEKKFKQSWLKSAGTVQAKRSIVLRSCFNINKKHDTKKHVIALYTKDDCFCIVFDSEEEMNRWLRTLLSLQRGEESEGEPPRPTFEHVWDVYVQRKGLGESCRILGNYRLCTTEKTLSLVRIGAPTTSAGEHRIESVEFPRGAIRRTGATQRYFYLEVGRSSDTGAGEIWMEAQDAIIAQNINTTIMKPGKSKETDNVFPMPRNRSSSANAASKPTQMLVRRQTLTGQKPINCSPSGGGAVIARERCDSLPSRNRTASETNSSHPPHGQQQQQSFNSSGMPPPRTIPSAAFARPQSMVVGVGHRSQSHSNSPPVYPSPLSPPSTGACSTGSDGSSQSIDETDSFMGSLTPDEGNGFSKVINARSIPEENSEEYINNYGKIYQRHQQIQHRSIDDFGSHLRHSYNSLSLPISQAIRRSSPAPPANIVGSADAASSGNYMDMCSPCGSSPGDPSGIAGYIPMSPIGDFSRGGINTGSSSAHSRASSLAEDTVDGYVAMSAPSHAAEEYVDMDPTHNGSNRSTIGGGSGMHSDSASTTMATNNGNISSAASSCSITSGTPSTDMRFSEYHLEKVVAHFTPSEDDEMDRPLRTYSVGSRMEHNKRKLRVDMLSSEAGSANSRVRAFSVGSRAKVPRSELYKGSGAPITAPLLSAGSSGSMQESVSNSGSLTNTASIGMSTSSVGSNPATSAAKTGKKSSSTGMLAGKPHGSFDPMEDLMEIDFSATTFQAESETASSTPQKSLGMEDYMEMSATGGSACSSSGVVGVTGGSNAGYVEMKPGGHPLSSHPSEENDYLDMMPGGGGHHHHLPETNLSTKSTSSPIQINSPKKFNTCSTSNPSNNYLEMSPRACGPATSASSSSGAAKLQHSSKIKVPSEDYLNINPLMLMTSSGGNNGGGDSGNEDKMLQEEGEDMIGPAVPTVVPGSSSGSAPDGYMEMSWSSRKAQKPATTGFDEYINMDFSRLSSQPIAIQQPTGNSGGGGGGGGGLSRGGSGMLSDDERALEPKIPNYLPLQPAMQRHGSSVAPTAAAQIGFSPKQNNVRTRCDSRDSGIVTPSGSQATIFPFSPGSPVKSFTGPSASGTTVTTAGGSSVDCLSAAAAAIEERKCYVDATTGTLRISEHDEDDEFLLLGTGGDRHPMQNKPNDPAEASKLEEDLSHNYAELSLGQQQQQKPSGSSSSFSNNKRANLSLTITATSTNLQTGTKTVAGKMMVIEYPDYVNCGPATVVGVSSTSTATVIPKPTTPSIAVDDQAGDYAIMNPASLRKHSSSSSQSELAAGGPGGGDPSTASGGGGGGGNTGLPPLTAKKSNNLMCFKPITSSQDEALLLKKSIGTGSATTPTASTMPKAAFCRQYSERRIPGSGGMDATGASIGGGGNSYVSSHSRPNSVNSEKIASSGKYPPSSAGSTRPNSANSDRLPIISATSSSASSTSTLCESKNQSPTASSAMLAGGASSVSSPPVAAAATSARPDSVTSLTDPLIVSRPPSVSSERELHYASLDLPPCSTNPPPSSAAIASGGQAHAAPNNRMEVDNDASRAVAAVGGSDSLNSSPSPNSVCTSQQQTGSAFTYAQIDFLRSGAAPIAPSTSSSSGTESAKQQPQ